MAAISLISIIQKNFQLLTPPKVWVSSFRSVNGNGISVSAIMKKLKNGCHFFNIDRREKYCYFSRSKCSNAIIALLPMLGVVKTLEWLTYIYENLFDVVVISTLAIFKVYF